MLVNSIGMKVHCTIIRIIYYSLAVLVASGIF